MVLADTGARFVLLAALVAVCGCGGAPEKPRGVILITIDTCRADRLGSYGDESGATPTLDAIAENGLVFLDALAPAPITLPSHCSILTGLYPDRHGVRDNGAGRLPDEARTLPEVLEAEGWRSAAFVAAVPLDSQYGVGQGFSVYDDDLSGVSPVFPSEAAQRDPLSRLHQDQRTADQVVAAALPWIEDALKEPEPFLAWIHFFDPHISYRPPARFGERFRDDPYQGEIAFVDEQIGVLWEALGDEREKILFAITADHGESLGEHGENTHGFFLYDSAIRVPWILAGPGVPKGERRPGPVSLVQVLPTLLDVLEIESPAGLDGASALAAGDTAAETPVYAEALFPRLHFDWAGSRSVRVGSWKYIEAPRPELYDLSDDPDETRNRIDSEPARAAELKSVLERHWARGTELAGEAFLADESSREQLEALGYVGAASVGPVPEEAALWDASYPDPKDRIELFDPIQDLPQQVLGGDPAASRAFVEDLFRRDPGNLAILRMVGRLQLRAQQWENARRTFREMVKHFPERARGWADLANVEEQLGLDAEALGSYERVIELDPGSAVGVNGKALLLSHDGREREAVALLREKLPLLGDDVETLNNLAWILANAGIDPEEGYRHARKAAELAPDDPVILDTLGWSAIRAGRPEEAITPLRKAWSATRDAEVRAHLGVALAQTGAVEEGVAHVRAAVGERASLATIPEVARWNE